MDLNYSENGLSWWSIPLAEIDQCLKMRPKHFPTIKTFRPKNADDQQVLKLLIEEARETRKIRHLQKKVSNDMEGCSTKNEKTVGDKFAVSLYKIYRLWEELEKRFPQEHFWRFTFWWKMKTFIVMFCGFCRNLIPRRKGGQKK